MNIYVETIVPNKYSVKLLGYNAVLHYKVVDNPMDIINEIFTGIGWYLDMKEMFNDDPESICVNQDKLQGEQIVGRTVEIKDGFWNAGYRGMVTEYEGIVGWYTVIINEISFIYVRDEFVVLN